MLAIFNYVVDTTFGYCPIALLVPMVGLGVGWWIMAWLWMIGEVPASLFLAEWVVGVAWTGLCLIAGMIRKYTGAK